MIAMVLAHEALHLLFAVVAERSDIIASLSAGCIVKVWKNRSNCRVVCDILRFAWETTAETSASLYLTQNERRAPQSAVCALNSALRHGAVHIVCLLASSPQILNLKNTIPTCVVTDALHAWGNYFLWVLLCSRGNCYALGFSLLGLEHSRHTHLDSDVVGNF